MKEDIKQVLITKEEIQDKVKELGRQISQDYKGKNLVLIGVLKGAFVFLADLIRNIDIPVKVDFMAVSSYGTSTTSSGVVRILKDLDSTIEGKDILVVEDIIDTGLTLSYLIGNLKSRGANSVGVCALLDKPERRKVDVKMNYKGFDIPDEFIVGYGLDYSESYRNLDEIYILKEEAYK
ncbi:hypoxanthine phosphoribosyltransferase Hpt [Gottschalkia acidurici 9a]|uniref:Hypoxanthine phosphoribosyltransferase n=1 Tax=Gottschalkia acidurici (strain ATCC 7906 / DSM 604 / BCRC 14475 / CIP 104303 / KCTC 5404 / NCIMB 10678 / 9a) TaxID=1128398 RepID=K0AZZ3_GOTA9|nr:hypoxanthine phosphoribosyltransferase [Gottschalkia acidurici]AFS79363.1 hypoxanthine phosphoribosyltransferase Hpt [Gottschalkia acidurici 9a]